LILKTSFRIERKEEDLRSEAKVFASIYHQDEATALEGRRNWYEKWDCRAFKSARIDKLLIREIQPTKGDPYRLRFKSATEATEALGEIQRICKATP
jgi:hypothetical protein